VAASAATRASVTSPGFVALPAEERPAEERSAMAAAIASTTIAKLRIRRFCMPDAKPPFLAIAESPPR
jgi:hypothetical protein